MTDNTPITYRVERGSVFKLTMAPAPGSGSRFTCFVKVTKPDGSRELWRQAQLATGKSLTLAVGEHDLDAIVAFDAGAPASETCAISSELRRPAGQIQNDHRSISNDANGGDWISITLTGVAV